jgi:hypothetical protein
MAHDAPEEAALDREVRAQVANLDQRASRGAHVGRRRALLAGAFVAPQRVARVVQVAGDAAGRAGLGR